MEEYLKKATDFAYFLASTPVYKNYIKAKAKIDAQPELAFKIKEFKRVQMESASFSDGAQIKPDCERYVSKLYSDLQLIEETRDFLNCEQKALDMLSKVDEIIYESCKIDMDF